MPNNYRIIIKYAAFIERLRCGSNIEHEISFLAERFQKYSVISTEVLVDVANTERHD